MTTADLVQYIEKLRLTHGAKAGKPFKLLAWQRAFLNISANGITDFNPLLCLPKLENLHLRNISGVFDKDNNIIEEQHPALIYLVEKKTPRVTIQR